MIPRTRLLFRLSTSHVRRHPVRTLLTCLGIALGVGAVTGVLALSSSIIQTFEASVAKSAGAAQLQISNGTAGLDRDLIEEIARVPGVAATGATVQHYVVLPEYGMRLTIFGVELGRDEAYREVQTGPHVAELPDGLTFVAHTDSIALTPAFIEAHGLKLGDTVEALGPRGRQHLTLRGRLHPRGPLAGFGDGVALMDLDAAQLRFGDPARVHWIDVVVDPNVDVGGVEAAITRLLGGHGAVAPPLARSRHIETMLSLLRVFLTGASLAAMLVGIFLIHHTLATSYRQGLPDLLRLRAVGLSRRGLGYYLIAEATVVGAVASTLGIASGVAFWRLATRDFSGIVSALLMPLPTPQFALSASEVAAVFGLGIAVAAAGALLPARAVLQLRPFEARTSSGGTVPIAPWTLALTGAALMVAGAGAALLARNFGVGGQLAIIAVLNACEFVGVTLLVPAIITAVRPLVMRESGGGRVLLERWVWHQIVRRALHTSTTVGALAAGIAFAVSVTILLGSYRAAVSVWLDQMFGDGDVIVNAGPTVSMLGEQTLDGALAAEIEHLDSVVRVSPARFVQLEYRGQPIILQVLSDSTLARLTSAPVSDGAALVTDAFAERFGTSVGDQLEIPAPISPLSVRVADVVPDYILSLGNVKIGWPAFTEHFGDERVTLLFVNAKPGTSPTALKQHIDDLLRDRYDVMVMTAAELRQLSTDLIDRATALTYWMQVLAALVAVATIVNATATSIIDRRDELQTWRALGLRRRRLIRMIVGESAIVALIGGILGLVSGTVLGVALTTSIARAVAGYRLAIHWPLAAMFFGVVLSTTAAAGAATAIAVRSTRGRPLAAAAI